MMTSVAVLEFHHNSTTVVKYNHLKISGKNFLHLVNFIQENVAQFSEMQLFKKMKGPDNLISNSNSCYMNINNVTSHTYFLNTVTQLLSLGFFAESKIKRINFPQAIMNYNSHCEFQTIFYLGK